MNQKTTHLKDRDINLKIDQDIFRTMSLTAQKRELDIKEVLKYELGPSPWPLSTHDGMLRNIKKILPTSRAEKVATPVDNLTQSSGYIINGKSVVQKIKRKI